MIMAATIQREYPTFKCLVCGTHTRFHHLDAKLCSACASFYRRAIRENLQYKCDSNTQRCQAGKGRYACRACRFVKCSKVGARLPTATSQSPPPISLPTIDSIIKPKKEYHILNKLVNGYELFLKAQEDLVKIIHPELRISTDVIISKRKTEHSIVSTKTIPLMLNMFCNFYGPFNDLDKKEKKRIMTEVLGDFEIFRVIYLTVQHFPELKDTRLMDTTLTYFDLDPKFTSYYYDGFINPEEISTYQSFMKYPLTQILNHIDKFRKANLRKIDCVSIMFLTLYKKAEKEGILTEEMSKYRDEMLVELSSNLCEHYGDVEGPQHMTKILFLIYETDNIAVKLKDYILLSQINLNKSKEELLCGMTNYLEQLKIECECEFDYQSYIIH